MLSVDEEFDHNASQLASRFDEESGHNNACHLPSRFSERLMLSIDS